MDFRITHWLGYPRRFPAQFPLASSNRLPRKSDWVRRAFTTFNFSLILRGRGEFHRLDRVWEVVAPCVITQWPGEHVEYGPSPRGATWDEVYLIYNAELMPRFEAAGLIDRSRPVWPIHDFDRVRAVVDEFAALTATPAPENAVDRIDRLAERLVLETLLMPDHAVDQPGVISGIVEELRANLSGAADFDEIASRHGMSRATFRRRWSEAMPLPPARYLQNLRMREACRLLVETVLPVRQIARAVGFEDELYFSRRFDQENGMSPRAYRKTYALREPSRGGR